MKVWQYASFHNVILGNFCSLGTGKHSVDAVLRQLGVPGSFILTGNFYENMILRKYVSYDKYTDIITMKRPVVKIDTDRRSSTPLRSASS